MKNPKQIIVGAVIIIMLVFVALYLFVISEKPGVIETEENSAGTEETLELALVPEGWKVYVSNDDWSSGGRIAFAYPPQWNLEEEYVTVFEGQPREYVRLEYVHLMGDGYRIRVHQKAHGASPDWTERNIGGYSARMWQWENNVEGGVEYGTTLAILDTGFIIDIVASDELKEISDQFLSTVKFEE